MGGGGKIVNVGIDLGTSRSSISVSNGQRQVIESYVGYPVDMVARKVLKREVLVGREALDNRSMVHLFRPLEEGLIREGSERDEAAVRQLLLHLLSLAGLEDGAGDDGDATDVGEPPPKLRAVIGVPAEALRVNRQQVRKAMMGVVDNLMIVSEPFAVAYGLEALLHTMIIDIGAGTTDFCVMKGRFPTEEEQRTLTTAGDWVDQQLYRLLQDRYPEAAFSIHMVRDWKEKHGSVAERRHPVRVSVPVAGRPTEIDITQELRQACEGLLPPLVETMLDLLSRVEPEFQERVRHNIILAGGTALIDGLGQRLQQELQPVGGGRVRVVKDPVFCGSDGGLALAMDAPDSDWEKLAAG